MDKIQDVIKLLEEYHQEHIIKWMDKLDDENKRKLVEQIKNIDLHQILELYETKKKKKEIKENKIEEIK